MKPAAQSSLELFAIDPTRNLLPGDGVVNLYGRLLEPAAADRAFEALLRTVEWKHDEAVIHGRRIVTAREVAWYGDAPFDYTYSGATKRASPWTDALLELKLLVERACGECFNSCLLNLYHNGDEGMTWHSDDERMLVKNGAIASLSLGAERKFAFKHKRTKETVGVLLEHGSLLVMRGATQTHWLHSLPKSRKVATPRVNLTFRQMATP